MKPLPSPNFAFLSPHNALLAMVATQAENYFFDDPNTALLKLRQFGEEMVKLVAAHVGVRFQPNRDQIDKLDELRRRGFLPTEVVLLFQSLRSQGNKANHEMRGNHREALHELRNAYQIAVWFQRSYGNRPSFDPGPYQVQDAPETKDVELLRELEEMRAAAAEQQKRMAEANAQLSEAARQAQQAAAQAAREAEQAAYWQAVALDEKGHLEETQQALAAQKARLAELEARAVAEPSRIEEAVAAALLAGSQVELSERDTRRLIDEQLRQAGWEADSELLTHAAGVRPAAGRLVAIAEWPCGTGRADYVLFHGLTALGVIEAKARANDVPGVLAQARRYAVDFVPPEGASVPEGGPWEGGGRLPFLFATNGRRFLRQLGPRSGVWFLDARQPNELSRPLAGWYTPAGLLELSRQNFADAQRRLAAEPTDYLGLRPYQLEAIAAAEKAISAGRRACLLAMATGTGKTRMVVGLAYRLLKAKRFRRILFLVDRNALGEQAAMVFRETRLEGLQTFVDTYGVAELSLLDQDDESLVHVGTVQSLVKRILRPDAPSLVPPIDTYDCIIIDECHRGYVLDRDMGDLEMTFRDQDDFLSKYRRVLDHFDAVKVGLTATPALHTAEIFGAPVFWYSYRQAVLDGYLVDHEPPVRIETELSRQGVQFRRGDTVRVVDASAPDGTTHVLAPDDLDLDVEDFNRRVIAENFNRVVCEELARHLNPNGPAKTLIFAVNDSHADTIVHQLKLALQAHHGSLPERAVAKITGAVDDPLGAVRDFKLETWPTIAVTVDLLTTGIDVPPIDTLVFLRRVRSRILFAQMLGRATRLCPDIGKQTFRVFDAIGIYDTLEEEADMKPVVRRPSVAAHQLMRELGTAPAEAREGVLDELIGRIRRRAPWLKGEDLSAFKAAAGGLEPGKVASLLRTMAPDEALAWLKEHPYVVASLDDRLRHGQPVYVSDQADRVVDVRTMYGEADDPKNVQPADYLERLRAFLEGQRNTLPALVTLMTAPRSLTRKDLRELRDQLFAQGFREAEIQVAWRATRDVDVAASLLGFLRQMALGDPLLPYADRVQHAVARVLDRQPWSPEQRRWIERFGKTLAQQQVLDHESLDEGVFRQEGGFARINRLFHDHLDELIGDLNEEVWKEPA